MELIAEVSLASMMLTRHERDVIQFAGAGAAHVTYNILFP
jgi:hypothetical protein